jgi:hypothetical protein
MNSDSGFLSHVIVEFVFGDVLLFIYLIFV